MTEEEWLLSARKTLHQNLGPYVPQGTEVDLEQVNVLWWNITDGTWSVAMSVDEILMTSFFIALMGEDDEVVIIHFAQDGYTRAKKVV